MTNGGAMVNAIPERTVLESYVRGASFDVIIDANYKVNRALCGAALSLETNIEICDTPGYAPLENDKNLIKVFEEAAKLAVPEYACTCTDTISSGSTDMGDLSGIMPVVYPYAGGAKRKSHGNDYEIVNPVSACVGSAKVQLTMLYLLLCDNAKRANEIIKEFKPALASKEDYFNYVDKLNTSGDRIEYCAEDVVKVHVR